MYGFVGRNSEAYCAVWARIGAMLTPIALYGAHRWQEASTC